ncbi:MAG: hypothetical protein ACLFM1_02175 [Bacteroidales bacterium]
MQVKINRKTLVFGLFLAISTILWLLNALNKEYAHNITYPVIFKNLPSGLELDKSENPRLDIEIHGHGYDILSYKLDHAKPPLIINLDKTVPGKINDDHYYITSRSIRSEVSKRIKGKLNLNQIKPDTLHLYVSKSITKQVFVSPRIHFKPARQYMVTAGPFLTPDTVEVTGSRRIVNTIDTIFTKKMDYGRINSNINRHIPLEIPEKIVCDPQRVKLSIHVEKYTETGITVPVEVINIPDSIDVELVSNDIRISFQVPVSKYKQISEDDFRLRADFQEARDNKLYPELVIHPEYISRIRLHQESVKFIRQKSLKE